MRFRSFLTATIGILAYVGPTVGQTSVGQSSPCGGCHYAQSVHQGETPMANALLLSRDDPLFKSHPKLTLQKGPFFYDIETKNGITTYSVSDGSRSISVPIHWSAGQRMQTWVLERAGKYYESLVSYYPTIGSLQVTVGDDQLKPQTLEQALGRELTPREVRDCFGCHSTDAISNGQLSLNSLKPGVGCSHCHAGADGHLIEASQGVFDFAPPRLKDLSSEDINEFCGQCHRSWDTGIRNGIRGVANVRFQPYRLENSKCFDGSDPRIGCLACHDPHQPLVREDSAYDSKCLACHVSKSAGSFGHTSVKTCPIASSKCVSCHMLKTGVNTPAGLITFTDHDIRVVKPGEAYPN